MHDQSEILGHEAAFDCLNHAAFQSLGEDGELGSVIQLGAVEEAPCPCENAGD